MKHRRVPRRRTVLVAAGVAFRSANASEPARTRGARALSGPAAGKLASNLPGDLGADTAGASCDAGARSLVADVLGRGTAGRTVSGAARAKLRKVVDDLGEEAFFRPVTEALSATGARLG